MELTFKIIQMPNAFRLVVWEESEVIEIFECKTIRQIVNQQLELISKKGLTDVKFRVRT